MLVLENSHLEPHGLFVHSMFIHYVTPLGEAGVGLGVMSGLGAKRRLGGQGGGQKTAKIVLHNL